MRVAVAVVLFSLSLAGASVCEAAGPRARALGVPFYGTPGPLNAITDVAGITVGQVTLIASEQAGHEVRTGVTAILPRGRASLNQPVFGAWFSLNGAGEMTGTTWLEESGMLEGPIMLTNTHSVGVVHDAVIAWRVHAGPAGAGGYWWSTPIVAETWDGYLNDINGFHVRPEHAFAALDNAVGGVVEEGNVGGGTGMICHEFKCGIGTSSRKVRVTEHEYLLGVLVQANYGVRDTLTIAGVPIGRHLQQHRTKGNSPAANESGSIIIVVATDAPLLPHQLKRIARRAAMGLARNGSYAGNGSGDIFIAFSTANLDAVFNRTLNTASFLGNDSLDTLFLATVEATEEAIVNALVAAQDMFGQDGHYAIALPHDQLRQLLRDYHRLKEP